MIEFIDTSKMSYQEWLLKRNEGIGGSDISALMGMNPYFSNLELFYQKIGLIPVGSTHNEATFWGTALEPVVRDRAQYYDFETGEYISNYEDGRKLRGITEKKMMIRNGDHPQLLANTDGFEDLIETSDGYFEAERIAEIKTISKQSEDQWEGGLPPYYIPQGHTYMIVCEPLIKTQEVAFYVLRDGRTLWAVIIKEEGWLRDAIIEESDLFWDNVLKAREILANEPEEKAKKAIEEFEPDPNPTDSAEKFISDLQKHKTELHKVEGDQDMWEMALAEKQAKNSRNTYEDERQAAAIILKNHMRLNEVDVIDFGESGRVTFRGKLYNNIKIDA